MFDRLHFVKLFTILIVCKLSAVIIRILFENYINQDVKNFMETTNVVKQGGVLSLILFSIYIDKLLKLLPESGFGCKIG